VNIKQLIALAAAAAATAGGLSLTTAGAPALAAGSAQASGLPQLTITMNGSSISVGGALQSGAVDVVSTTTNEPQGQPTLVRLNPGVTPDQAYAFLNTPAARDLNNAGRIGSIVFAAEADRGVSHVQTSLQPGQYLAIDPSGSNPAKFPHTSFAIGQAAQPAALPRPQATIKAVDFAFRGPRTLHRGELVRFENDGFLVHMTGATEARNAKAAPQIVKALRAGNDNRARRLSVGGIVFANPVSPGAAQQLTVTAKPGYWVLACFMTTQDGREHTQLGQERIVHIVR
jgi:hypothetical protein